MTGHHDRWTTGLLLAGALCLAAGTPAPSAEKATASASSTIPIAVPGAFFRDLPSAIAKTLTGPLKKLVETQTGFGAEIVLGDGHEDLARLLEENKVQLAVMHGFEYAWIKDKHPALKPLLLAVGEPRQIRAYLVTAADSPAKSIQDLAGKTLVVPPLCKQHTLLFLDRQCRECGKKVDRPLRPDEDRRRGGGSPRRRRLRAGRGRAGGRGGL